MLTPQSLGCNASVKELLDTIPYEILSKFPFIEQWADSAQLYKDADYSPEDFEEVLNEQVSKAGKLEEELEEYKGFFKGCFDSLSADYPCAEVSSGYDCNVIYEAIRRGEECTQ